VSSFIYTEESRIIRGSGDGRILRGGDFFLLPFTAFSILLIKPDGFSCSKNRSE